MLESWTGPQQHTMPFLSPPTAVLSMGPLTIFPPGIAWSIWTFASIVVGASMVTYLKSLLPEEIHAARWIIYAGMISLNVFALLLHGQTTIMTTAALLALYALSLTPSSLRNDIIMAAILTLMTGKPQVALVAILFLVSIKKWRSLGLAACLTLTTCLVLTPWFGYSWPLDYIKTMSTYGSDSAFAAIADQVGTLVMTNFRAFVSGPGWISSGVASQISWLLFILSSCLLIGYSFIKKNQPAEIYFALAAMIYLLFSPHLNGYEDLLMIPVVILWLRHTRASSKEIIGLLICMLIISDTSMGIRSTFPALQNFNHVFLIKLLLGIIILIRIIKSKDSEPSSLAASN